MEPVAVVIPTLNEAGTIGGVIREIPRAFARDIIVADSGSTDGTQAIATAAGARVLDTGRGYGRACAMAAAAADPGCRVIVFLDGDGADRGDLIARIAGPVLAGEKDFVLASRTRGVRDPGSMLWHQVLAGRVAGLGMGTLYGVSYSDMCAFRAIDRAALEGLRMREMTYGWNIEMQMKAARARLRILEVPMPYRRRAAGQSKVAGSLRGTMRASTKIVSTFLRVAAARS
jgi:glycosyltransferase involved in cell wall biosynthesis